MRRELARIVPELGAPPPPLSSDAERLRFYQAKAEALQLAAAAGLRVLAFDDLQFVDEASMEAGEHSLSEFWGDSAAPLRTLHVYRSGELSAQHEARIQALVSAGLAVRITLERLSGPDIDTLLGSLDVPLLSAHRAELGAAAGGNPLLLLEASRHLLGSGDAQTLPTETLPGRLGAWLGQRLERLTPAAVQLARVAAMLGPDLKAESAAALIGTDALELAPAWAELEAAQVLRGTAFTHDLLAESVLSGMASALRELLHRRAAAALEAAGIAPARIAAHWEAGGEPGRAARWWLRAGDQEQQQYRYQAAATLYGRVWQAGEGGEDAFEAGLKLAKLLGENEADERAHQVVEQLLAVARRPAQYAAAHAVHCQLLALQGEGAALEAAAQRGLTWARQTPEHAWEVELLSYLGSALFFQGRLDAALEIFRDTARLAEQTQHLDEWCIALGNESAVLGYLGRRTEAGAPLRRAEQLLAHAGRIEQRADVLNNLGNLDLFCGRVAAASVALETAQQLLDQVDGAAQDKLVGLLNRVGVARLQEHHGAALRLVDQGLTQGHATSFLRPVFLLERARLLLLLGADSRARAALAAVDTAGQLPEVARFKASLLAALLAARQGGQAEGLLAQSMRELQEHAAPLDDRVAAALAFAPLLAPERVLQLTDGLPEETLRAELFGLRLALLVRRAQAHLALGQLAEAEAAITEVLHAPADLMPACPRAEVLFTHARLLGALGDARAAQTLQAARAEVLRVADSEVPGEYRASFLALPLPCAVLQASEVGVSGWAPLSDAQWNAVSALLEPPAGRGRPRRDERAVLDAALWFAVTGRPWKELPPHFPAVSTVHRRFQQWRGDGTLQRVLRRLEPFGGLPRSALIRQLLRGDPADS